MLPAIPLKYAVCQPPDDPAAPLANLPPDSLPMPPDRPAHAPDRL